MFGGALETLGEVGLVAVQGRELSALWQRMLETYHPLGGCPLYGAPQHYLIRSPVVGWLGAVVFSAAA